MGKSLIDEVFGQFRSKYTLYPGSRNVAVAIREFIAYRVETCNKMINKFHIDHLPTENVPISLGNHMAGRATETEFMPAATGQSAARAFSSSDLETL